MVFRGHDEISTSTTDNPYLQPHTAATSDRMSDNTTHNSQTPLAGSQDSKKVDIPGRNGNTSSQNPGRTDRVITVQPPRREDLQPSYAQTLVGESDTGSHGWYGAMGTFSYENENRRKHY